MNLDHLILGTQQKEKLHCKLEKKHLIVLQMYLLESTAIKWLTNCR